jgi:CRP-like cAMP-binding protein
MEMRVRVAQVPLFQRLPSRRLAWLLEGAILERYDRGATLLRQGERAEAFWVLLDGWVHLLRTPSGDGSRAAVLFTITPEEVLCGISALESGVYRLSGVAASACTAVRFPSERFAEALKQEPGFAYEALRLVARRFEHVAQQYGAMAEPVPHRIVRSILRLRQQFGNRLPMTHRELAQMSWTTTESAIRTVRSLKRRGWLAGTRGRVDIRDAAALERLVAVNGHGAGGARNAGGRDERH